MTSRDLYAGFVGLSGGFAAQCVVHYLLRPSIGLALCLVTLDDLLLGLRDTARHGNREAACDDITRDELEVH